MQMGVSMGMNFARGGGGGAASPYGDLPATDDLLGAWDPANYAGSGTVYPDLTGNNDGTIVNSPTYESGVAGGVFDFVAVAGTEAQHVNGLHNTNDIVLDGTGASISAWVYPSRAPTQWGYAGILMQRSAVASGLHVSGGTGNWNLTWANQHYSMSGPTILNNVWQLVTCRITYGDWSNGSNVIKRYAAASTTDVTITGFYGGETWNSGNTSIGRDPFGSRYFDGYIGVVALWNSTVSETDFDDYYTATKSRYGL